MNTFEIHVCKHMNKCMKTFNLLCRVKNLAYGFFSNGDHLSTFYIKIDSNKRDGDYLQTNFYYRRIIFV